MVAAVRLIPLLTYVWFLLNFVNAILASPIAPSFGSTESHHTLHARDRSGVIINDADGGVVVFNSQTQQPIPQGSASDGGGSGFNTPAVLWIVLLFLLGVPLAVAGIRGWRLTLGVAIGLSIAVCSWAAFINTVSSQGFPDIALDGIVFGFFVLGFVLGLFEFARVTGIACLGALGGLAVGMRIVLFKNGLIVHVFFVNWLIVSACAVVSLLLLLRAQRIGIILSTSSTGTFFIGLGVDLAVNQQKGMSRGLRFLFDQNTSHIADMLSNSYTPPLSTKITLGASLALIPLLAFIQHKIFRDPFERNPPDDEEIDFDPSSFRNTLEAIGRKSRYLSKKALESRFSI
ncbi:hypothetical protein PILCRDRAFT_820332 [Piloderma croceum F 1598]|uniref:TM7S3/TM198-like domain-containing protein n=1 Tax=Piloderma croceum (strain F 1598) TaxID=765440 RepID=A0A0C3B839_PILCF|nr:hypothetical protein PILCRDRAFT_820332 [Piloderma croceum F 1598]